MAIPVFRCTQLEASLAFYAQVLGAALLWRDHDGPGPGYAAVRLGEHELHLSSHAGDGVTGAVAWLAVPDVDGHFAQLQSRGYVAPTTRGPVFAGPTTQTWATRELYVSDPDGNVLRFGTSVG